MSSTLTDAQAYALAGGLIGGFLATFFIVFIVIYVLLVIALWKIFTKAGEAGWKSLIPIYNAYVLCKIIGVKFWTYVIIIPIVLGFVTSIIFSKNPQTGSIITSIYTLGLTIYLDYKLAKAFGKGVGFTIGLVLLPNIFQLILGFGSAEYVGAE